MTRAFFARAAALSIALSDCFYLPSLSAPSRKNRVSSPARWRFNGTLGDSRGEPRTRDRLGCRAFAERCLRSARDVVDRYSMSVVGTILVVVIDDDSRRDIVTHDHDNETLIKRHTW